MARFNGRLTGRTVYGVSPLSGLPLRKTFSGLPSSNGIVSGEDVVMENLSDLFHCFVPLELYLTTKRSVFPALVFPSSPPLVPPVT